MINYLAAENKIVLNRDLKPALKITKTAPYPVRHRDNISAKEERTVNRWLNRVTLSPHTSRSLATR
jgi:hypothetical protein